MTKLLNKPQLKKFLITITVLILMVVVGLLTYTILARVVPRNSNGLTNETAASRAENFYDDAVKAEDSHQYLKAQKAYEQALPYYKSKSEGSVADKNKAYSIEARIAALKDFQMKLEQVKSDEHNIPGVEISQ